LLRTALTQFPEHYHEERNRQVKNNVLLFPAPLHVSPVGDVPSAVENASGVYSATTAAPHEYLDQTGSCHPDPRWRHRCRYKSNSSRESPAGTNLGECRTARYTHI